MAYNGVKENFKYVSQSASNFDRANFNKNLYSQRYQPIIDATTGIQVGSEALTRRIDGIKPDQFFPKAKETGEIVEIDMMVLGRVCDFIQALKQDHITEGFKININLSAQTLATPGIIKRIKEILKKYPNLTPNDIGLEIIEDAFEHPFTPAVIDALANEGFTIYMDDYGEEASNLDRVKQLNKAVHCIKISKELIDQCHTAEDFDRLLSPLREHGKSIIIMEGISKNVIQLISDEDKRNLNIRFQCYDFGIPEEREPALNRLLGSLSITQKTKPILNGA